MRRVYKYPLEVVDRQTILMPAGADVIACQAQGDDGMRPRNPIDPLGRIPERPMLWALVDAHGSPEARTFRTVGTGRDLVEDVPLRYVGTYQLDGGALVFHVFEEVR